MHIYLFAPIAYDFLHQRPQKLAEQFRLMSIPVTYIQPTGFKEYMSGRRKGFVRAVLSSLWYHLLAVLSRLNSRTKKAAADQSLSPSVQVVSLPLTFPVNRANSTLLEAMMASAYRQFLRKEVLRANENETVAIFQNPFWGRVVEKGDFSKICYDCIDDVILYAGKSSVNRFRSYEDQLVRKADCVVTTAAKLEEHLRLKKPDRPIHRIPNGVDYDWFQDQGAKAEPPEVLRSLKHPIVGYVGSIAGWMDYKLIAEIARMIPDMAFVFVGPAESSERIKQLQTRPNIHWLGQKPYSDIPAYIKQFDVCIIPFIGGDIAQSTNPVKVFEYFAMGKPVVSTPIDELIPFVKNELVLFGDSAKSFSEALKRAVEEKNSQRVAKRMDVAKSHSWQIHAHAFVNAINNAD